MLKEDPSDHTTEEEHITNIDSITKKYVIEQKRELGVKSLKDCAKAELTNEQRLILKKWIYRIFYVIILVAGVITDSIYSNAFIGITFSCLIIWSFVLCVEFIQWMRELICYYPIGPLLWIPRKEKYVWILPD